MMVFTMYALLPVVGGCRCLRPLGNVELISRAHSLFRLKHPGRGAAYGQPAMQTYCSLADHEQQRQADFGESSVHFVCVESQGTRLRIGYLDEGPLEGPVVVGLHGHPGSAEHFKELVQPLTSAGVRLIAPHMPGYGVSHWEDESKQWKMSSTPSLVQLLQDFLHTLGLQKALRPFFVTKWGAKLVHHPLTARVFNKVLKLGYKLQGFAVNENSITDMRTAVAVAGQVNYKDMKRTAECLRAKSAALPLMVYTATRTDRIIEWQVTLQYAEEAGVLQSSITQLDSRGTVVDGPKIDTDVYPRCLVFERGGHFVHRAYPSVIVYSILQTLDHVKNRT